MFYTDMAMAIHKTMAYIMHKQKQKVVCFNKNKNKNKNS